MSRRPIEYGKAAVDGTRRPYKEPFVKYSGDTATCERCREVVPTWFILVVEHGGIFEELSEGCFACIEGYPYPGDIGGAATEDEYIEKLKQWKEVQSKGFWCNRRQRMFRVLCANEQEAKDCECSLDDCSVDERRKAGLLPSDPYRSPAT